MKIRKHQMSWFVVFAVALSLGLIPQVSSASDAEGQFIVNDETVLFTHAYALAQPNPFDKAQEVILVIVTNLPLSAEAVEDEWARKGLAREEGLKYVELAINPEQQLVSLTTTIGSKSTSISGLGKLELKTFDEKSVEGRFYSDGEQSFFDDTFNVDFTFTAEIQKKAELPPAKAEGELPPPTEAEMEEAAISIQAAAYREFATAIHAADLEAVKSVAPANIVQNIEEQSEEENNEMLEFMQLMTPVNVEFQRISVDGDSATLTLSAEEDGLVLQGTIGLIKEGDDWKIDGIEWE